MLLHIIILIDVSYSMTSHIFSFTTALNKFLQELKQKNINCRLSVGQFSTELQFITEFQNVYEINSFDTSQFRIQGTTALYDAIGNTIRIISNEVHGVDKTKLFVISDGDDNASFRYNKDDADRMMNEMIQNKKWEIQHCHTDMNLFTVPTVTYDINDISNIFDNLAI